MKKIIIDLSDLEEKLMLDMVLDINDWITSGPFKEKIANHKERIKNLMRQKYIQENKPLPSNEEEYITAYFSDSNYKNRKQREQEVQIEALKKSK